MPVADVVLHSGSLRTGTIYAVLDTGSIVTVFQQEFAMDLDIDDVTFGVETVISTGAGPIKAYLFAVEMELSFNGHRNRFACQVAFAENHIPRNILGRNLVFQLYTFAFVERDFRMLFKHHSA